MSKTSIVRLVSGLAGLAFCCDGIFALFRGHAFNSTGVMLDAALTTVSGAAFFGLPMLMAAGSKVLPLNVVQPKVVVDEKTQDVYALVDALRLLVSHKCIGEEHTQILEDIMRNIILNQVECDTKEEETADATA